MPIEIKVQECDATMFNSSAWLSTKNAINTTLR